MSETIAGPRAVSGAQAPLVLALPEPPSLNAMIELAKKRTRRSRTGGWMKRTLPVVYDQEKEKYETACLAHIRTTKQRVPRDGWKRWKIERIAFRLHNERDLIELTASLKWPVDWLVNYGVVEDDSPRHLVGPLPDPEQCIERSNRGITITLTPIVK